VNKLKGRIVNIDSSEAMSLVEVDVGGDIFSSIVLETPQSAPYLKCGNPIDILFKETEVSIAKNLSGQISIRNRIKSVIKKIECGEILAKITLDYKGRNIVSIITTKSAKRLELEIGETIDWLVKTNEVSLCHTT
jgi:molybdopterin-binding protein